MLGQRRGGGPGPERRMAGTSGRLAAGPGRLTKALPPRREQGRGDIAAELRSGLPQQPITLLHSLGCRMGRESIKAHSSAPLQYPKSPSVPMHTDFCQRESTQP